MMRGFAQDARGSFSSRWSPNSMLIDFGVANQTGRRPRKVAVTLILDRWIFFVSTIISTLLSCRAVIKDVRYADHIKADLLGKLAPAALQSGGIDRLVWSHSSSIPSLPEPDYRLVGRTHNTFDRGASCSRAKRDQTIMRVEQFGFAYVFLELTWNSRGVHLLYDQRESGSSRYSEEYHHEPQPPAALARISLAPLTRRKQRHIPARKVERIPSLSA